MPAPPRQSRTLSPAARWRATFISRVNVRRNNPMTQFSIRCNLCLNRLSQKSGQVHSLPTLTKTAIPRLRADASEAVLRKQSPVCLVPTVLVSPTKVGDV
jgi:hypothetical protein